MLDFLFRRPRYLALTLLTITSLGVFALQTIGRQEDPTITNLFATVITPFPGADPARVEALVTEKIEAELREIPEIDTISSVSATGISSVQIELSSFISNTEIEQAWSEIRDALADAAVEFPQGVPEPNFDNDRTGAFSALIVISPKADAETPLAVTSRVAESLQDRLRGLPNTKRVELFGAAEEEIRVEIDSDALVSLGVTTDSVARALALADAKVSSGRVRGDRTDYLIEVAGEIESLERIRTAPLTAGDGSIIRVGDVAKVSRAVRDPAESIAYADGVRAVIVAARMTDDKQIDRWAANVRDAVEDFQAPASLNVAMAFDQSAYTAERLEEVAANLAIGVALVVSVLFITMGWRSAMVVAFMLPLTALLSLTILQRLGVTIQQMSVTGLIVALGLLVDAAIVVTDEIRRRIADGVERGAAVSAAIRRLTIPLAASTVTTVLAFVPMAALPGPAGDFVGSIALSVIVMLVTSFLLALTVAPAMAGLILPARRAGDGGRRSRFWRDGLSGGWLGRAFAASLGASLRWRRLSLLAAAAPGIVGFMAFPTLQAQFFPAVDRDQFYVQVELSSGAALAQTDAIARRVDETLRGAEGVEAVQWVIGESAPPFYYNMLRNRDGAQSFAEALVTTSSPDTTARLVPELQEILDQSTPEARVLVRGLKQGPPVNAPVEMRLVGPELEVLRSLGDQFRAIMAETPHVTHTRATLSGGAPKLIFDLDEDRVRLAGLTLTEAARQVRSLTEGSVGGALVEGSEELPVRVRGRDADRGAADQLANAQIVRPGATTNEWPGAPLLALGDVRLAPADGAISRRNGERTNTIQAFLTYGVLPEEGLKAFQARLADAQVSLPAGYRIEWGGDSDARGETVRNLLSVVGFVVVGTLAAIMLTFNSWRLTIATLGVAALSMGLSLLALAIFNYPFGIQALIGVIGSIGVSINAAIIIMTALQEDEDAARGDTSAMREVVLRSSRHIVSTTITTFGGFLPLILAGGGFWPPFAMAIGGGVLLSTIISFYFAPAVFSLLVGRRDASEAMAPSALPSTIRSPTHRALEAA